jgi:RecB family exonuclease
MAFLERIARKFLEQYGNRLHELVFVFPNRRAGLYFNRWLHKCKPEGTAFWAPRVYSVNDFVVSLSPYSPSDSLDLVFELYNIYNQGSHPYRKPFEEFYAWGKMILADFNEIDKYLLDAVNLFKTLKDFKEIEDITRDEKSGIYNRYIDFWDSLGHLYRQFNLLLHNKSKAYEGMIYRQVAEHIHANGQLPGSGGQTDWQKIIFCGFNALTPAEEVIIRHLLKENKAEIYWDMDAYFVDDTNQEAGRFFRENRKSFNLEDPQWIDDRLSKEKTIDILGVQSKVSQSKVLGLKLQRLLAELDTPDPTSDPVKIAVVLPDETLLFPTLNSLPQGIEKINITIGFPLNQTPAYSLFNAVIEMQLRTLESGPKPRGFYYKDVQKVLNHPYIKPVAPETIAACLNEIKEENRVYVTQRDLSGLPEPLKDFFRIRENSDELIGFFLDQLIFIRSFYDENKPELFNIDYEYMYHFYTLMTRLKDSLGLSGLVLDIRTFRQLFTDIVRISRIPFTGEPLEGLQIMGMLETQTLDFDYLFILSVNEDHLPPGKGQQSFIPYGVRYHVGLPTHEVRDAIAAYHFYRLLKRAKHTTLIYTTGARGIEKSEKSRFIDQLLIEFADRNPKVKIEHSIVDFSPSVQVEKEIDIEKSPAIIEKLKQKSYSASALLTYLTCSLKFYFTYVLGLYEEEDISESPDYRLIGTIMHETLERLYKPFRGKKHPVNHADIDDLKSRIVSVLTLTYRDLVQHADIESGRNMIIFDVMRKLLEWFFDQEKKNSGFYVLMLEEKIKKIRFDFPANGKTYRVNLEGAIDRLDRGADGVLRIIDYKTGETKSTKLNPGKAQSFTQLLSGQEAVKNRSIFQLFFYRYLLKQTGKYGQEDFRLVIYPFKKITEGMKTVEVEKSTLIDDSHLNEYESILTTIFTELFTQTTPFTQTEEPLNCHYCPYKNICTREEQPGGSF